MKTFTKSSITSGSAGNFIELTLQYTGTVKFNFTKGFTIKLLGETTFSFTGAEETYSAAETVANAFVEQIKESGLFKEEESDPKEFIAE